MKFLFICTGNTCRSPMAEAYLKQKGIYAESRGLAANGMPASQNAVFVMKEIGIDISGHISRQLTQDDIRNFDRIICLAKSHFDYLSEIGIKCEILGDGISDPYGGDTTVYRHCRDEIINAIDGLFILDAKDRHIDDITEIEKACFSHPWTRESIISAKENRTHFFVYEICEKAVGYVGISVVLDEGYITNLAVLPKYRNKGVASSLLKRLDSFAKQKALAFISLEVRKSNNTAISLYEKFGYKTEGCRKNFYDDPREDALIMTKRF